MKKLFLLVALLSSLSGFSPSFAKITADSSFSIKEVDSKDLYDYNMQSYRFDMTTKKVVKNENIILRPTIELNYGIMQPGYDVTGFNVDILKNAKVELKLGSSLFKNSKDESIFKYKFSGLAMSNFSGDLGGDKNDNSKPRISGWNIGFSNAEGYGYNLSKGASILLYTGGSMNWNFLKYDKPATLSIDERKELDYISTSMRLGEGMEAGVKFQIVDGVALNFALDRNSIYPRHLFWKWAGSRIMYEIGSSLLDNFVEVIGESSPNVAPIVNFVLKNAYSYGFYELKKKNMNWPFNTGEALIMDTYKIGMSFNF